MEFEDILTDKIAMEREMQKHFSALTGRRIPPGLSSEQIWSLFTKDVSKLLDECEQEFPGNEDDSLDDNEEDEEADDQDHEMEYEDDEDGEIEEEEDEDDEQDFEKDEDEDEEEQDEVEVEEGEENEGEQEGQSEDYDQFMNEMDEIDENPALEGEDENELEMKMLEEEDENEDQPKKKSKQGTNEAGPDAEELFDTLAYGVSRKNIARVEKKLIEKKEWQMRGEIRAVERPVNALLDVDVDFETGLQSKIIITKETNEKIESIIKQRILDHVFDDRQLPPPSQHRIDEQTKSLPDLNFEKDKRGLAGVYEDEYKQLTTGVDPVKSKADKLKDEIKELFKTVCFCIDNMSRFNFTPSNSLAARDRHSNGQVVFDEKVPVVVSSKIVDNKKSFKDVHDPKEKELKSKVEMSTAEKKRLQRKIKITKKRVNKIRKEKDRLKSGISVADSKLLEKNKSLINKQISDSKVKKTEFTKNSNFFQNLNKISSSN